MSAKARGSRSARPRPRSRPTQRRARRAGPLGRFDERARDRAALRRALLRDVLHALEQNRQRLKILRRSHPLEGFGDAARAQRDDVAGGRGGAHDLVGEPPLLDREAHALDREGQRGLRRPRVHGPVEPRAWRRAASNGAEPNSSSMPVSSGRSIRMRTRPASAAGARTDRASRSRARRPATTTRTCRACPPATPPPS